MSYTLPDLGYAYDALEPFIDAKTMEIHHTKHHQTYVDKLNTAIETHSDLSQKTVEELLESLPDIPEDIRIDIQNHGGGHANHSFFWKLLKKNEDTQPIGELATAINDTFGSFDKFKTDFTDNSTKVFGSGWTWLVKDSNNKLSIISTPLQDSPLSQNLAPIIGLDIWEHAYYLKYQNKRPDYIAAFWNIINWKQAEENFKK